MKILLISNNFPPHERGGYEQLCRDVGVRLQARGHGVMALTSDEGTSAELPTDPFAVWRKLKISPTWGSGRHPIRQFFLDHKSADSHNRQMLHQAVAQFEPDAIFIWNMQGFPRSLAVEAERIGRVFYWLAGYSPAEPDEYWVYWNRPAPTPIHALLKPLAIRMMRAEGLPLRPKLERVAVVSQFARDKEVAAGTLPSSATVIYNGVELEQFVQPVKPLGDQVMLLVAGRVSEDKGVHTAVEAVGRLQDERLHLTIAGTGPNDYRTRLESLAEQFGVSEQVTFTGWLPREEIPDVMKSADILLLPTTHTEPFARVVLEGMASGLLVIGSDIGGTPEIVRHEETGLLFRPGDSDHLAQQIKRVVNDRAAYVAYASAGQ